ncbi:MAG: lamin tail domain-containing protein [Patescibacteria group bacterium]|nr:lamin tail domain-containing protein [Patescibacteria group bacterium]
MNVKFIFLFFLSFLFLFGDQIFASSQDFIVSEIMYEPQSSGNDDEWVEVYNNGSADTTITLGSSADSLRLIDGSDNRLLKMPSGEKEATVDARSYFVIAHSAISFKNLYPDYNGILLEASSMDLNNTSQLLGFREGSNGTPFAQVTYETSWRGTLGKGHSIEKENLAGVNDGSNWVGSYTAGGTPGQAYKEPVPVNYPQTVKINEFMPNPKMGSEWVELYNSSDTAAAELTGWQIDDKDGGSSPKTFSATLPSSGYFVFYFSSDPNKSSSILNNSEADQVRLIRPDGVVSDTVDYSESKLGFSYALINGSWEETSQPTPGAANVLAGDPEIFKGIITEIKSLPLGHKISLEAYISSPPGLLGDKELYVWDKESGIKISCSQTPDSKLGLGDKVKVSSTLEESNGEKYIKTETVTLIQPDALNVEPRGILTGEATENYEGSLVKVEGKLEEQSGDTFYLNDGSGRVKVYIKDSTGIVKPKLSSGDLVKVVGIVSQYGLLKSGDRNYRILPRFQSDIVNITEAEIIKGSILGAQIQELPRTGINGDFYVLGWIFIFIGLSVRIRMYGKKV